MRTREIPLPRLLFSSSGFFIYSPWSGASFTSSNQRLLDVLRQYFSARTGLWIDLTETDIAHLSGHGIVPAEWTENHRRLPDEKSRLETSEAVKQLSLMVHTGCNFECAGCFVYADGTSNTPQTGERMPWSIARAAIEEAILSTNMNFSTLRFFGGEPLLNWAVVDKSLTLLGEHNRGIKAILTTNGALLDDAKVQRLAATQCKVFVSLDGTPETNDRQRQTRNKQSAHAVALAACRRILQHSKTLNISTTFMSLEAVLEFPRFLRQLAAWKRPEESVYVYASIAKGKSASLQFDGREEKIAQGLVAEFGRAARQGIFIVGRLVHAFVNAMRAPDQFDRWCERGTGLVVYPNGDLRACSGSATVVGTVGNLEKALQSEAFTHIRSRNGWTIPECADCPLSGPCSGGCECSSNAPQHAYRPATNCEFERAMFDALVKSYVAIEHTS